MWIENISEHWELTENIRRWKMQMFSRMRIFAEIMGNFGELMEEFNFTETAYQNADSLLKRHEYTAVERVSKMLMAKKRSQA